MRWIALGTVGLGFGLPGVAQAEEVARPAPKRCLAAPLETEGDLSIATSLGLSEEDAAISMSRALPAVLPCLAGASPTRPLVLSVTVACGGVVDRIVIDDAGDWPEPVSACVTDRLRAAEFPAHDRPDGDTFLFPVTYTAP